MVQFTADQPMHDKLAQAQELMRHVVPRGDFVAVFDRALDLLIEDRKKKLFGLRTRSRSSCASGPAAPARSDFANDAARAPATPVAASVESGVSDDLHGSELDETSTASTWEVGAERCWHADTTRRMRDVSADRSHEVDAERAREVSAEHLHELNAAPTREVSAEHLHELNTEPTREVSAERSAGDRATRTREVSATRTQAISARTREVSAKRLHADSAPRTREVSAERLHPASTERSAPAKPESHPSKYIPRAVRREVMARDGHQCTFVGPEGNRCPERGRVQLDHFPVPASCGGPATSENLRVRCAAHNLLAAEQFFGRDRVLQKIAASRAGVAIRRTGLAMVQTVQTAKSSRRTRLSAVQTA
jgi:hypothetical protein